MGCGESEQAQEQPSGETEEEAIAALEKRNSGRERDVIRWPGLERAGEVKLAGEIASQSKPKGIYRERQGVSRLFGIVGARRVEWHSNGGRRGNC